MDATIDDVLTAHEKEGYLVAVSDGSVKHMYHMSFWLGACVSKGTTFSKVI